MVVFLCSELCSFVVGATVPGRRRHRLLLIGSAAWSSTSPTCGKRVVDAIPDREAMVCGERRLTYARRRRARHAARAPPRGARRRSAATTSRCYLYNGTEYLEGMLAAFKLRAVPINVNYRYVRGASCGTCSTTATPRAIVFHREFAPTLDADRAPSCRCSPATSMVDDDVGDATSPPTARDRVRGRARGGVAGTRLRSPLRRRPLHPLHGRHHRHAQGRDVAGRGHLLRRVRRREPRRRADHAARGDRRLARPRTGAALPACPFMHGTAHWMAFATLYSGGTVVISPDRRFDPTRLWRLIDERTGDVPRDRGRRLRPSAGRARSTSSTRRPTSPSLTVVLSGGADPLAVGEVDAGWSACPARCSSTASARRRPAGRARASSAAGGPIETAPRFAVNDETTVLDDDLRPGGARRRSASSPAAVTCPSGTTRTRRRRRRRSRWSTACAGRCPATTPASRTTARSPCSAAARCRSTPAARRCTPKRSSRR